MSDKVEMHPVKSSNIEAIGHAGDALHVKYKSGQTYVYAGVPESHFHNARSSDSVGKYINANIKGTFDHAKLPDETPEC